MTPPRSQADEATLAGFEPAAPRAPLIPRYLEQVYWWAYVHPNAVTVFEREWLVSAILFGHYGQLRDAALAELGGTVQGSTLQVACVYGNLTPKLRQRLAPDARLDIVDILPIQLKNLGKKLPPDPRVALLHGDSSSLACPDASYDQVLLFFLLHEQPEAVRRGTLAEAFARRQTGRQGRHRRLPPTVALACDAAVDAAGIPQARAVRDGPVEPRSPGLHSAAPAAVVDGEADILRWAVPEAGANPLGPRNRRPGWTFSKPMWRSWVPAAPA